MEEPLAQALATVSKKYQHQLSQRLHHLSIDRYHYVLVLIDNYQEALSQKALADLLNIDKSYMVCILDYLGENGYIIREKNPQDRREQMIKLTSKARTDLPFIKGAIEQLNNLCLKNIGDKEKQTFRIVIHTIQSNLSDDVPNQTPSN